MSSPKKQSKPRKAIKNSNSSQISQYIAANYHCFPIVNVKNNRKLTLGEIRDVYDCKLISGELAFIVTLRSTNVFAIVFRRNINTNSLRHAVPFVQICKKYNCSGINQLNQYLANQQKAQSQSQTKLNTNYNKMAGLSEINSHPVIVLGNETTLKDLAKSRAKKRPKKDHKKELIELDLESSPEAPKMKPKPKPKPKPRPNAKRRLPQSASVSFNHHKFWTARNTSSNLTAMLDDTPSVSHVLNAIRNSIEISPKTSFLPKLSTNKQTKSDPVVISPNIPLFPGLFASNSNAMTFADGTASESKQKQKQKPNKNFKSSNTNHQLIPIPKMAGAGAGAGPAAFSIDSKMDSVLNDLQSSPNLKSLISPNALLSAISKTSITQHHLLPPLEKDNPSGSIETTGTRPRPKAALHDKEIVMIDKPLVSAKTNPSVPNSASINNISCSVLDINHPLPLSMLPNLNMPELSSQQPLTSNKSANNTQLLLPPMLKRRKTLTYPMISPVLLNGEKKEPKNPNKLFNEKIILEGIIKMHHTIKCEMGDINTMSKWSQVIRALQSQRLELFKLGLRIRTQANVINIQSKQCNTILTKLETQTSTLMKTHASSKQEIEEYKKEISNIYDQISKLTMQRKILEKKLQAKSNLQVKLTNDLYRCSHAQSTLKPKLEQRNKLLLHYKNLSQLIGSISEQYSASAQVLFHRVRRFEPHWRDWNVAEVVTWFENVNNGEINKMNAFKYFRQHIITYNICGNDLQKLNDVTLKMCGFSSENDRTIILRHLQRLFDAETEKIEESETDHEEKVEVHLKEKEKEKENEKVKEKEKETNSIPSITIGAIKSAEAKLQSKSQEEEEEEEDEVIQLPCLNSHIQNENKKKSDTHNDKMPSPSVTVCLSDE